MDTKQSHEFAPMKESKEDYSNVKQLGQHEDTPFGIVETNKEDEDNCFVAIGNRRLTGLMTREECERMIDEKDWNLITQLIMHIGEHSETIKKINELARTKGMPT